MTKYILKRILYMALTLLIVTSITFFMLHAIPDGPITKIVQDLPEETRQTYLRAYGFDRPVWEQYFLYMRQLLTGEAKGLSSGRIVLRHMLRNTLLPCITMICVSVAGFFSGSFIVESIFSLPGLGTLFHLPYQRVVLGLNVVLTGVYVCSILVSDILQMLLAPRIRTGERGDAV